MRAPSTTMHGGVCALILDHVGRDGASAGTPGGHRDVDTRLRTRYCRLNRPLRAEASRRPGGRAKGVRGGPGSAISQVRR